MLRRFKVRACPDLSHRPQVEILVEAIQTVEYMERVENCSPCGACALTPLQSPDTCSDVLRILQQIKTIVGLLRFYHPL